VLAARAGTTPPVRIIEEAAVAMSVDWELVKSGPDAVEHSVLLLPGGANAARSYSQVMAQPVLAGTRLVAATLPGNVGTPPPTDFSIESYAQFAAELAANYNCDVVVGFSMGASVALEMATSGAFKGPLVLLGISLSERDEPAFFRAIVRLGTVLGSLPSAMLIRMTAIAVRTARVSDLTSTAPRCVLTSAATTRGCFAAGCVPTWSTSVDTSRPPSASATPGSRHGSSTRKRATAD
jgi:pimeloyl-ACP methyl ester carboxylesterase